MPAAVASSVTGTTSTSPTPGFSSQGIVLRTDAKSIAQLGRATRGVRVMHMQEGDSVATMARFSAADMRRVGADDEDQKDEAEAEADNTETVEPEQSETK